MTRWNKKQQAVLDSLSLNKNILVSAAAGSGKTAVLVERILETLRQKKCGIRNLLIVTFTRAAAQQMKEKIRNKLEQEAGEDPALAGELSHMEEASILTIDSFCSQVVKENYHLADIDPGYEILDQEAGSLLKDDVLSELFQEELQENPEFQKAAQFYIQGHTSADPLKDVILGIYRAAMSLPEPEKWLASQKIEISDETGQALSQVSLHRAQENVKDLLRRGQLLAEEIQCLSDTKPEACPEDCQKKMRQVMEEDLTWLEDLARAKSPDDWQTVLQEKTLRFMSANLKKKYPGAGTLIDAVADFHSGRKKKIPAVVTARELAEDTEKTKDFQNLLIQVTGEFMKRLLAEKKRQKKFEFEDISHFAYRILFDPEKQEPTAVARRFSEQFYAIYIDEYQDSNDLQEHLLNAVARRDSAGNIRNIFMVGDVKQSIYKFRLARPELFLEKQRQYGSAEDMETMQAPGVLLHLNQNYRSRKEILDSVNFIFRKVMTPEFGGISYDEEAALHAPDADAYAAAYPEEQGHRTGGKTEIYLVRQESGEASAEGEDDAVVVRGHTITKDEEEAQVIARVIRQIVEGDPEQGIEPLWITDTETVDGQEQKIYRKAEYRDIVILQRGIRGSNPMMKVYEANGIPVRMADPSGYFDAAEITSVLGILKCISNSRDDIAAGTFFLMHPFGFTETELAEIVSRESMEEHLTDQVIQFAEDYEDCGTEELDRLSEKARTLIHMLNAWQKAAPFSTISGLIQQILRDTELDYYMAGRPDGAKRMANLESLTVRAEKFDGQLGGTLFQFLRYMERCRTHDIDFSEAVVAEDQENTVSVATIHSSKGLEYPVVILARMGHQFNLKERMNFVHADPADGIATDDLEVPQEGLLIRKPGVRKKMLDQFRKEGQLTEEARLLYVAMTRAREKLILTGVAPGKEKEYGTDIATLFSARSYLDFLEDAMAEEDWQPYFRLTEIPERDAAEACADAISGQEQMAGLSGQDLIQEIQKRKEKIPEKEREKLARLYRDEYPYQSAVLQKTKLSVSEIKENRIQKIQEESQKPEPDYEWEIDDRANGDRTEGVSSGARRGTLIHRILELLPFDRIATREDFQKEVQICRKNLNLPEEDRKPDVSVIDRFYSADPDSLFQRMKRADQRKKLYREQQFITGFFPSEIPGGNPGEWYPQSEQAVSDLDRVTIQGVIDAFFEEEDGSLTLVDYKTDRVSQAQVLIQRYAVQMYIYQKTLEKLTGKRIHDIILCSFTCGEIHCLEEIQKRMEK